MSGKKPLNSGFLLIEILLAVALMSLLTVFVLSAFIYGRESTAIAGDRSRAAEIANQSVEALQNIAHDSYSNLSSYTDGTTYYLDNSGSQWTLSATPTIISGIFTPQIVFNPGPNSSRKAVITVTWTETTERSGTVSVTTYFTDWQASTAFIYRLTPNLYRKVGRGSA